MLIDPTQARSERVGQESQVPINGMNELCATD